MTIGHFEINMIAVIMAAVLYAMLGPVWYSKFVFGRIWMKQRGLPEDLEMDFQPTAYMWGFLLCLTASFSLAVILAGLHVETIREAVLVSGGICAGFVLTTTGTSGLFTNHKMGLWFIDNVYHVVGFMLAGFMIQWF